MVNFQMVNFFVEVYISQEYAVDPQDLSLHWWDSDDEVIGGDVSFPQVTTRSFRVQPTLHVPFVIEVLLLCWCCFSQLHGQRVISKW